MTEDQQKLKDEAIATTYVRARQRLDVEHHSRLAKAWELVIDGAVSYLQDGHYTVKGKDQPEYTVTGVTCTCVDCTGGKAPEGRCKHVLATMLYRRSAELFQELAAKALAPPPAAPAIMAELPEAPISTCMKGTLARRAGDAGDAARLDDG